MVPLKFSSAAMTRMRREDRGEGDIQRSKRQQDLCQRRSEGLVHLGLQIKPFLAAPAVSSVSRSRNP